MDDIECYYLNGAEVLEGRREGLHLTSLNQNFNTVLLLPSPLESSQCRFLFML